VVVSLPDQRKGERLVLITTDAAVRRDQLQRHARGRGASELMVPADILLVDSLPLLGSGKPDYVAAIALAKERPASEPRITADGVAA
jgi:acyl-[acyl-carrier-protein]-phospholipid O-acyltransferase/long-chain-fatty-acid--[acyl-carrier-protein] ligase